MFQQENYQEFQIKDISFNSIYNLNLEKLQLKKLSLLNQYLYESMGFKILTWELNPKITFLIIYGEDQITIETNETLIKGIGPFSEFIKIRIKFKISKELKEHCVIKRSIILGIPKKPKILKLIPNNILENLLSQSLELIANRVDKKFFYKISYNYKNL